MSMTTFKNWLRQHTGALIFAGIFALSSLIRFIPPNECCFIWQRQIQAIILYFHGFANFLSVLTFFLPVPYNAVINLVILFTYGMILGLFLEALWKWRKWLGKLLVTAVFAINALPGSFVVTTSDTLIGQPYAACQKNISDEIAVRIVAFPEEGFIPGAYFFFSITQDAGKTWRQFMFFRHDDPVEPPCENIRSTTSDHIWAWMGWQAAVTNNAGKTWQIWRPQESWPDWICCNYGLVKDVTFQDNQNGRMVLDPIPGRNETDFLATQDGGRTWR